MWRLSDIKGKMPEDVILLARSSNNGERSRIVVRMYNKQSENLYFVNLLRVW